MTKFAFGLAAALILIVLGWQVVISGGAPDPSMPDTPHGSAILDIGVLVFREGLECILVLAAVTASMVGESKRYQRPVALGVGLAFLATLATWRLAIAIIDNATESIPALHVQVVTGLVAIVVLLVVMNWFFHKMYWSGWISLHTRRKRSLMQRANNVGMPEMKRQLLGGLVMLGFTSLYREGFEVVLFLQSYRLRLGGRPVLYGVGAGLVLCSIVAVITFVAHHRLPYRRMLIVTGGMLGMVLLVMVGEEAQEMQLAHWLPTTPIPLLVRVMPDSLGMWLALFPTVETLGAQLIAALLVVASYATVNSQLARNRSATA